MIDTHQLAMMVAELCDQIENEYPDSCEIGTVAVVFEVTDVDEKWSAVGYRCSDTRPWVQVGFFQAAERAIFSDGTDIE